MSCQRLSARLRSALMANEIAPGVSRGIRMKGDRSFPAQIVHCSGMKVDGSPCAVQLAVFCTAGKPLPPEAIARIVERKGWIFDKRGKHKCPSCQDADEERRKALASVEVKEREEMSTGVKISDIVSDPTLRKPTVSDRRKMREALDANYDDHHKRYVGNKTDQSIGQELGVPWAWVRDYREENYGPLAQGNVEMERLKSEIGQVRKRLEEIENKVVSDFDVLAKRVDREKQELVALGRRLAAMEDALVNPR